MKIKEALSKFHKYLKKDTWDSWLVSLIILLIIIKFVFFPLISLATASSLPLVIVESCSMYHETSLDNWWDKNSLWYESQNIQKSDFETFTFKNGLNKGDIILVWARTEYEKGDIIIFEPNPEALSRRPIIHRIISENPIATKGDHNTNQFNLNNNPLKLDESSIPEERILGKAVAKIPLAGWAKLIFFEPTRPEQQRGLCR
jgi:signal peptidase I